MTDTPTSAPRDADSRPAPPIVVTLQILRLPAALGLLALVAQPRNTLLLLRTGLYAPGASSAAVWARITLAALAFALIIFVARRRTAPRPLLVVEAIIAGALAFVPPYLWAVWLDSHPISRALNFELVAPLAIAWFAVAVIATIQQPRERARVGGGEPETPGRQGGGGRGDVTASLLLWLRIPALLALLALVAASREELLRAWSSVGNFELVWAQLTIPALAFVLVALIGRHDRAPWPPLAVEVALAAALAFTPPHRWLGWLKWNDVANALSFEFTSPLAITWLAIAVLTAITRHTRHRPHVP